ncbi:MAG: uroporphyrinogen-III C-methyltransferase [Pseudomonadales bacterium]
MASDTKDDSTPSQNNDSKVDTAPTGPERLGAKNEPPVLSDTVSTDSLGSPTTNAKPEAKPEAKPKTGTKAKSEPKSETKPASKTAEKTPAATAQKTKKSGSAIGWLALLIALLALAGVAYGLWIQQQEKQAKGIQESRLNQSQLVDSFKSSTQVLSSQVQGFISTSENQQQRLSELQTQLQATNRQIGEVTQVSRRSWMLAEAEYLLRLANQRLLMERETVSALALLNSADQILISVAEPGLFEIRETLARETAALRAVAHLDVEGVFVKLAALSEQVESLALLTPEEDVDAAQQAAEVAVTAEENSVFEAALERFNDMVIVRHRDEPLAPLLAPEQHYYIQQNLRLMLEQAQLALLQRSPGVYTRSLEKAAGWVDEYFQLNETAQALLVSLRELQQLHVDPELPNISKSLSLLKAYLNNPLPGNQSPPVAMQAPVEQAPFAQPSSVEGAAQ